MVLSLRTICAEAPDNMHGNPGQYVRRLRTYFIEAFNVSSLPTLLLHRGLCIDLQAELVGVGIDVFEDVSHGMLVRNPVFLT